MSWFFHLIESLALSFSLSTYVYLFRKVCVYSLGWAIMGRTRKGSINGMPAPMSGCGYLRPRPSLQAPSTPSTSTQILGWPGMIMFICLWHLLLQILFKTMFLVFFYVYKNKTLIYVYTFISLFCFCHRHSHVFKRLKFLGNKLLSQMFTLLFLAIWHGLHSGYFICFSMEFLIVNVEKQVTMATLL